MLTLKVFLMHVTVRSRSMAQVDIKVVVVRKGQPEYKK